jgi:uncharacterized protein
VRTALESPPRPEVFNSPTLDVSQAPKTKDGPPDRMTFRTVWAFFALAFGISWGLGMLSMIFADQLEPNFGEMGYTNPIFILMVYAPALAGLFLVGRRYGKLGLKAYFKRLTMWRMPGAWWAFLILGIPAIVYTGAVIAGTIGDPFPFSPWYGLLPALALTLMIGPVEELGWRGVALPLLQRRFAPFLAALILGAFWGLWHLPSFFLSGTPQSAWEIGPYMIGVLAISIILTPMFNAAGGSILVAALFHFQVNGPAWPDAQPWDSYVYAAVALLVVILNRKTMFRRGGGVTDVVPTEVAGAR